MQKLSARNVVAVLKQIPEALTKTAAERDAWRERALKAERTLGEYQTREDVEKIAAAMTEKNLTQGLEPDELRQHLMQKAAEGKLDVVAEAVGMNARVNPLGFLGEDSSTGDVTDNAAAARFESAIVS